MYFICWTLFTSRLYQLSKCLVKERCISDKARRLMCSHSGQSCFQPFGSACSRYDCCLCVTQKLPVFVHAMIASSQLCSLFSWKGPCCITALREEYPRISRDVCHEKSPTAPPYFFKYFSTEHWMWLFHSKYGGILQCSVGATHDTCFKPESEHLQSRLCKI